MSAENYFNFGEGFEHVRTISIGGKEFTNTGYIYINEEIVKLKMVEIISGS